MAHGDFTMLVPDDERVYAFTRRLGDVVLLVLGNFGADTVTADVPDAAAWAAAELVVGNYPAPDRADGALTLRPWEGRVYRRAG
ncbi:MAG TPA: alpha-glucosidase C-terminal domain-containing protein [Actinomycetes bacterium]